VKFFGNNIRNLPLDLLYRNIVVVPQDPVIFADTVDNNIFYGNYRNDAEDSKIARNILDSSDAQTIRDGKQGKSKIELSGGERQKVAIARALLREPSPQLLILDEITSALDAKTQRDVMTLVYAEVKRLEISCLVVAHRLQTIENADAILVLSPAGTTEDSIPSSLVEYGKHDDLLAKKGIYFQLHKMESSSSGIRDTNNNNTIQLP